MHRGVVMGWGRAPVPAAPEQGERGAARRGAGGRRAWGSRSCSTSTTSTACAQKTGASTTPACRRSRAGAPAAARRPGRAAGFLRVPVQLLVVQELQARVAMTSKVNLELNESRHPFRFLLWHSALRGGSSTRPSGR